MDFAPKKISELGLIPGIDLDDLFVVVDDSDKAASAQGTTKKLKYSQLRQSVLDAVPSTVNPNWLETNSSSPAFIRNKPTIPQQYVLPKARTDTIGGVAVGTGLSIDANGVLRTTFTGSYNDLTDVPVSIGSLDSLSDVAISQVQPNDLLLYRIVGGVGGWVNGKLNFDNLDNIPQDLVRQNSNATLNNVSITGNLVVTGTTTSNNFETLNVGTSEVVLNDQAGKFEGDASAGSAVITGMDSVAGIQSGQSITIFSNGGSVSLPAGTTVLTVDSPSQITISNNFLGTGSQLNVVFSIAVQPVANAAFIVNRAALSDTSIRWNEQTDVWEFSNNGTNYYPIPIPSQYGSWLNLTDKPTVPVSIKDLSDVSNDEPTTDGFLKWTGNAYVASKLAAADLGDLSIKSFLDVSEINPVLGQVLKWNGNSWAPSSDLIGGITTDGAVITPSQTSSIIPFYYATFDAFPNPVTYKGAVAYTESGGTLHYAHNNEWVQLAKASDVQPNTDTTYQISTGDIDNVPASKRIILTPSAGSPNSITISPGGGVSLSQSSGNTLTISSKTYALSSQTADGNSVNLRLSDSSNVNDDVILAGADGLLVERTNENTITFRAPATTVTQYTDFMAKDAAAAAIINGTHVGITFTYDSTNKKISSVVSGGGGGGGTVILYDLGVTNTTTNQAIVSLTPSSGTADSFQIVGAGGTQISWNSVDSKITVSSTAPVNADWNATSGLAQILNKPSIPPAYTLPVASNTVLGGVKVGNNLTIVDGVLSAVTGSYTLPIASNSVLGGIKIGSGLSIGEDGTVTVTAGGGVSLQSRNSASGITPSLQPGESHEMVITGHKAYSLLKMSASSDSWVRVYVDQASMIADRTRSEGNDPAPGSGVIAEIRGSGTKLFTPAPTGFNNDSPVSNNVYVSVINRTSSASAITVVLTLLRLEA